MSHTARVGLPAEPDMRLSTRSRYAVLALVELARRGPDGGLITLGEIAAAQMLSVAYLEQLFGRLRRAGLVESARGPGGGYRLGPPAERITIAQVVEAVDEPMPPEGSDTGGPADALWAELGEQIRLFLSAVTLAEVAAGRVAGRARAPAAPDETAPAQAAAPTPHGAAAPAAAARATPAATARAPAPPAHAARQAAAAPPERSPGALAAEPVPHRALP
ncbi:Rrf2 family transcriptional regulator [Roseomonas sp. CCTCC AB2023176]|uniref:Rrf2 family transcriptional regulator n=1 Tax=Roseomonas sp. CCTCC AB2023176 TaxID=3342640 RepID=UPI0035DE4C00